MHRNRTLYTFFCVVICHDYVLRFFSSRLARIREISFVYRFLQVTEFGMAVAAIIHEEANKCADCCSHSLIDDRARRRVSPFHQP